MELCLTLGAWEGYESTCTRTVSTDQFSGVGGLAWTVLYSSRVQ